MAEGRAQPQSSAELVHQLLLERQDVPVWRSILSRELGKIDDLSTPFVYQALDFAPSRDKRSFCLDIRGARVFVLSLLARGHHAFIVELARREVERPTRMRDFAAQVLRSVEFPESRWRRAAEKTSPIPEPLGESFQPQRVSGRRVGGALSERTASQPVRLDFCRAFGDGVDWALRVSTYSVLAPMP